MAAGSVALVLGAGGVTGRAYLAGTIAALAEGSDWDARTADLIVGTSAGAGIGATLRAGLSPADHLARLTEGELSEAGHALLGDLPPPPDLPLRPPVTLGSWRPQAPQLLVSAFKPPWRPRLALAASGLMPRGAIPTTELGERVAALHGMEWPEEPLWIGAVRLRDGKRVVFGRDPMSAPLDVGTAVEASSAIPGYFRPVRIADEEYLDGATHSPTNADLTAGLGYELVVVISPMSAAPDALRWDPRSVPRALFHWTLDREVEAIRRRGTPAVVFEPTAEDLAVMRGPALSYEHQTDIVLRARQTALSRMQNSGAGGVAELA